MPHLALVQRAARSALLAAALLPTVPLTPALASGCLVGEWESVSYRDAVEAVLGPSYSVQNLTGSSRIWLRPDNTFAMEADGLQIMATKGSHQISLTFSGHEAGRYRQEIPGQFVLPEVVVDATASDIVVDGIHASGPADISDLFLWTPPAVVGATGGSPGHFVTSDDPNATVMPELTYTCDGDRLSLKRFLTRADAPPIIYQRVGSAAAVPPSASTDPTGATSDADPASSPAPDAPVDPGAP